MQPSPVPALPKLRRAEPHEAAQVYGLLKENVDDLTQNFEGVSFQEFLDSGWPGSLYFFYEDGDGQHAMILITAIDMQARKAEMGVISMTKRKGYATAAMKAALDMLFNTMGLHRVYSIVNADNEPMLNCCQVKNKGATTFEGRLRHSRFKHGKFIDQFVFSMLSTEQEKWGGRSGEGNHG